MDRKYITDALKNKPPLQSETYDWAWRYRVSSAPKAPILPGPAKSVIMALTACIIVGCATNQVNDSTKASLECGAGAGAAGLLLCKVFGGEKCAEIAAAAAILAAGGCYAYADNLEKRRKELAGKENDLDARLRYVRGVNKDTEELNRKLREKLTEVRKLQTQIHKQTISARNAKLAKKNIDDAYMNAKRQLAAEQKAVDEMENFKHQSSTLDAAIAKQKKLCEETQLLTDLLEKQRKRV